MEIQQLRKLQSEAMYIPAKVALERLRLLNEEQAQNDLMSIVAVFLLVTVGAVFFCPIFYFMGIT